MERIDCFLVAYHKLSSLNPVIHVEPSNLLRLFYFPVDRMHWTVLPFLAVCFVVSFLFLFMSYVVLVVLVWCLPLIEDLAHLWSDPSSTVFLFVSWPLFFLNMSISCCMSLYCSSMIKYVWSDPVTHWCFYIVWSFLSFINFFIQLVYLFCRSKLCLRDIVVGISSFLNYKSFDDMEDFRYSLLARLSLFFIYYRNVAVILD